MALIMYPYPAFTHVRKVRAAPHSTRVYATRREGARRAFSYHTEAARLYGSGRVLAIIGG